MKQSIFTSTILCTALALTACGGSDDSTSNAIGGSNTGGTGGNVNSNAPIQNGVFNYTVFDYYSDSAQKGAWGKLEYTLRNGSMLENISTVVGASPYKQHDDGKLDFRAGKGYISAIDDTKYTQLLSSSLKLVDSDTFQVSYPNTPLIESMDVVSFDISGKGKNMLNANTGILTDLDEYEEYFKAINYSFPQGSKCYVDNIKTNLPSYYFYENGNRDDMTLQQWVADEQVESNIKINGKYEKIKATDIVYENIGKSNELPAVRFKDQLGNYHAAVVYQGARYDASYTDGVNYETPVRNTNPANGVVHCWSYNKVAADYLAEQMKASYGN